MRPAPLSFDSTAVSVATPVRERWRAWFLWLLPVLLTALLYAPVVQFEFINFDDDAHVYDNRFVRNGLTSEDLLWAFGIHGPSQWHPLAWISHQIDAQFFGSEAESNAAGRHHATNLVWHLLVVWLLQRFLTQWTGQTVLSAWIALLYGIHPVNVETVAWVSERRNLLCVAFLLLGLTSYLRYRASPSPWRYAAVTGWFVLALMSKPLAVTFPCLLLLIDQYNDLRGRTQGRTEPADPRVSNATLPHTAAGSNPPALKPLIRTSVNLIAEKLPLFLLSGIACLLTIWCQQSARAISSMSQLSWVVRVENACSAYVKYLFMTVCPVRLHLFYPHPGFLHADAAAELFWPAVLSALLLLFLTVVFWRGRIARPMQWLGWCWYLGTLVPMIGLMQVGEQQLADRYLYLPLIGLLLILLDLSTVWLSAKTRYVDDPGCAEATLVRQKGKVIGLVLMLTIGPMFWLSSQQLSTWRSSRSVFEHALSINPANPVARLNLGQALLEAGETEQARLQFQEALSITPRYALAWYNLGVAEQTLQNPAVAEQCFARATECNGGLADAWVRLGASVASRGDFTGAEQAFQKAVQADPENVHGRFNLGLIYQSRGQNDQAQALFEAILRQDPTFAPAREALQRPAGR